MSDQKLYAKTMSDWDTIRCNTERVFPSARSKSLYDLKLNSRDERLSNLSVDISITADGKET